MFGRLLDLLAVLAGTAYAVASLATGVDVAMRNTAAVSMRGLVDIIEYGLFVTTFLAAPSVLRHNAHVQVDFLLTALPERLSRFLAMFGDLVGLAVSITFLVYSWRVTVNAYMQGNLVLKSVVFPEWWVMAVMPISAALLAAEFVRRLTTARQARAAADF